jgi:large subunit ribosomal protein L24
MKRMHVKKNDTVVVISGKDKGKQGKILAAMPSQGKVIVEGANLLTKHVRPRNAQEAGGRIEQEGAMFASKVMLYCDKCKKATRIAYKFLDNGDKVRACKKCGETFDA